MTASPLPDPGPQRRLRTAAAPAPGGGGTAVELDPVVACNRELATRGVRLRLERRGRALGLRGPLPRADGQGGLQVQRLSLGLSADAPGLAMAQLLLEQLLVELEQGSFRWERWRRRPPSPRPSAPPAPRPGRGASLQALPEPAGRSGAAALTGPQPPPGGSSPARRRQRRPERSRSAGSGGAVGSVSGAAGSGGAAPAPALVAATSDSPLREALQAFEQAFFAESRRRREPAGSRSTWHYAYRPYLQRLLQLAGDAPPSVALLEQTLESYDLASRSRQQCGIALAALARFQGLVLPADWSERSGGYGLHRARFRQLPSDGRILELVEAIPNPAWRLAYGLMATYGLRNHEVFFADFSGLARGGDRVLRVLPTSKTGEHQVWPFQPEWVERFGLEGLADDPGALPAVSTDLRRTTLKQVGQRVAEQFRRYGLPITPYDLRHAWAVRTIHIGLPDTVAARMMGHSVTIHTRTYHHWITRRDQQQAVDAALARLQSA